MNAQVRLRGLADTIGFAHSKTQMEAVMERLVKEQGETLRRKFQENKISEKDAWRLAISPHDDYSYVGYMYPLVLRNVKAKTIILFGVAHKAAKLNLENQLIFDSFTHWRGPYGNMKVSPLRESIMEKLPKEIFQVNDSMQTLEHSVEAILPFLQHDNKDREIISILVPYMPFSRMQELARPLADALAGIMKEKKLEWGKDIALVCSTDGVHYGSEEWGGKDYAFFGADTAGYQKAVAKEQKIMEDSFKGRLEEKKVELFTEYTVSKENYKNYQWTWCGRYAVPFGLLTGLYLEQSLKANPLSGILLGYATSLDHPHIKVNDLGGLGVTAPAHIKHWVGYAAVGFR